MHKKHLFGKTVLFKFSSTIKRVVMSTTLRKCSWRKERLAYHLHPLCRIFGIHGVKFIEEMR